MRRGISGMDGDGSTAPPTALQDDNHQGHHDAKNGRSAENGKPDPLRFADVQCLTQQEIAERLGWSRETISDDLESLGKNGISAENTKPDPLERAGYCSI